MLRVVCPVNVQPALDKNGALRSFTREKAYTSTSKRITRDASVHSEHTLAIGYRPNQNDATVKTDSEPGNTKMRLSKQPRTSKQQEKQAVDVALLGKHKNINISIYCHTATPTLVHSFHSARRG